MKWYAAGAALIVVSIAVIMAVPTHNVQPTTSSGPQFKKEGELTLLHKDRSPIVTIDIEIADDDTRREVGMMGRTENAETQGMLFVFQQESYQAFWMKNTILPLDILFIGKNGEIVTIHKNTTPFSEQTYPSTAPSRYVLEVNGGFTDRHGIAVGDRIEWKRL
jgi:uncharacterized protein